MAPPRLYFAWSRLAFTHNSQKTGFQGKGTGDWQTR